MKAAYIKETGGPDKIIYGDLPEPGHTLSQCLIKVAAVDVNPIDLYIRNGSVKTKMAMPYVLGRDLAGLVVATGDDVKHFKIGDRVWCTGQGWNGRPGTFSELAVVDEDWLHPIPDGIREEDMAAISLVGVTAHVGLLTKAKVREGDVLFVSGGTGGVGSSVVQMAKILGARVITTAGSDEKAVKAKKLGADCVIHYKRRNVAEAVRDLAPGGVDVWWETAREPDFSTIIPLLRLNGRIVIMAGHDARPQFPVGPFYTKSCSLFGFAILNSTAEELDAAAENINRWMKAGTLQAQIDRVLPLSNAAEAHRLQEESTINKTGSLAGKIVLKP
jgi:NADPH:quinone reductase